MYLLAKKGRLILHKGEYQLKSETYIFNDIKKEKNNFGAPNKKIWLQLVFGVDFYCGAITMIYLKILKILKNVWAVRSNLLKTQLKSISEN